VASRGPLGRLMEKAIGALKDPVAAADRMVEQAKGTMSVGRTLAGQVVRVAVSTAADLLGPPARHDEPAPGPQTTREPVAKPAPVPTKPPMRAPATKAATTKSPATKAATAKSPATRAAKAPATKAAKSPATKAAKSPATKAAKSPATKAAKSPAAKDPATKAATARRSASRQPPAAKASAAKAPARRAPSKRTPTKKAPGARPAATGDTPTVTPADIAAQVSKRPTGKRTTSGAPARTTARKTTAGAATAKRTSPPTAREVADVEDGPEVTTPVGTTAADTATNPDTTEHDLQQPGTEPLLDPSTAKAVRSQQETLGRAADPDKG
jgi:hypothetical protein